MTDSINRIGGSHSPRPAERVSAIRRTRKAFRDTTGEPSDQPEDKLDINPGEHIRDLPAEIDISLMMIRALIDKELPEKGIAALESFAPLGSIHEITQLCDVLEDRGFKFVSWHDSLELAQAMRVAAS